MKPYCNSKRILLIDHQPYWRDISTAALQSAGFVVSSLDTYNYSPGQEGLEGENLALVVLGCSHVRHEEQKLIDEVLADKQPLLVLCTSLTWQMVRNLFLKGVYDIADKPYNPANLIKIVMQAFAASLSWDTSQVAEGNSVS